MTKKRCLKTVKTKKFSVPKKGRKILREAIYHPHPDVQRKCFAVLLLSFLFSATLVALILDITLSEREELLECISKGRD
jgi:hypothetical protein